MYQPCCVSYRIKSFLLIVVICAVGCGKGKVPLVPVTGTVKINGKPASNIFVQFMPSFVDGTKGPTSQGTSDVNGNFELKTVDNRPGAALGRHIVILADPDEERPAQGSPLTKLPRLDSSYSTAKGGIPVEVVADKPIILEVPGPKK